MEQVEQVFFNVPLSKLEPIFKRWIKEAQTEIQPIKVEPTDQPEQLLTIHEAADFLKLTAPTIYAKVSRGELPHMKLGKRLYFSSAELRSYLKAEGKHTNAKAEQDALSKKGGFNG